MKTSALPGPGSREDEHLLHVAIVIDGNGRWATERGLPRSEGHRIGARTVRRIVAAAPGLKIGTLSLFAFSTCNWKRPGDEIEGILDAIGRYLDELAEDLSHGMQVRVLGRRDRLPAPMTESIRRVEEATAKGDRLCLRIAVDYSSREMLLRAADGISCRGPATPEAFAEALGREDGSGGPAPDVDLLLRPGGEVRQSDFLLWECAHAELMFLPRRWPDFTAEDLAAAVQAYHQRDRRFGAAPTGERAAGNVATR